MQAVEPNSERSSVLGESQRGQRIAALERADAYAAAGADMIFVEAPPSHEHLVQVARRYAGKVPVMANMVEGGKTPIYSGEELEKIGYKLVIFPGGTVRALAFALQDYFASLKTEIGRAHV